MPNDVQKREKMCVSVLGCCLYPTQYIMIPPSISSFLLSTDSVVSRQVQEEVHHRSSPFLAMVSLPCFVLQMLFCSKSPLYMYIHTGFGSQIPPLLALGLFMAAYLNLVVTNFIRIRITTRIFLSIHKEGERNMINFIRIRIRIRSRTRIRIFICPSRGGGICIFS